MGTNRSGFLWSLLSLCIERQCQNHPKGESGGGSDKQQNGVRHHHRSEKDVGCHLFPVLDDDNRHQDGQKRSDYQFEIAHCGLSAKVLSETPFFECSDCCSPRDIRINNELKHPDAIELNFVVFDLAGRAAGTEIPLLLKQWSKGVGLIFGPQQGELLSPFLCYLDELEPDTSNLLRLIEEKLNGLLSLLRSPPSTRISFRKC